MKSLGVEAQMGQAWFDFVPVIIFKTFPSISVKRLQNLTDCGVLLFQIGFPDKDIKRRGIIEVAKRESSQGSICWVPFAVIPLGLILRL